MLHKHVDDRWTEHDVHSSQVTASELWKCWTEMKENRLLLIRVKPKHYQKNKRTEEINIAQCDTKVIDSMAFREIIVSIWVSPIYKLNVKYRIFEVRWLLSTYIKLTLDTVDVLHMYWREQTSCKRLLKTRNNLNKIRNWLS